MATDERELTEPVDLCDPEGKRLNPDAVGWSRTPLHTGNLVGRWGRNKRWDYWAIVSRDLAISVTYADVDYLGMATIWWADLRTGAVGGVEPVLPLARGVELPDKPGSVPLRYQNSRTDLAITDDEGGTTIMANWVSAGRRCSLGARIDLPAGHESVNVVVPWSKRRFQYTSKHQARPASGTLVVDGEVHRFGADGDGAWGVLDVGRGRWPYSTRWNWGGGAGRSVDGEHVVGLQFGGRWTKGTGVTENGLIVDGRVSKIGQELDWTYSWEEPLRPWRVHHPDGSLDLTLAPTFDRHTKTQALVLATEVHQVFGAWTGHVTSDDGERIEVADAPGFAEESRSRW